MNDGQCIDGVNDFTCKCKLRWTGALCKINIEECVITYGLKDCSPCFNDGRCTNMVNNYTCECQAGYRGRNCEIDIDFFEESIYARMGEIVQSQKQTTNAITRLAKQGKIVR